MQNARNKTMATLITLFLMSAIAISLVALPTANAQSKMTTYAFVGAVPNPVGVGQQTLLHVGITDQLASVSQGWTGLTVTVTKPDGTTETLGPFRTDSTGGTSNFYVPSMVGNYTLQTHFPEQISPGGLAASGTIMAASDSDKLTLIVQQEPVPGYPGVPLPTEYWTRPINSQLQGWSSISGNWLGHPRYDAPLVPYNAGPESGHILWANPIMQGGLVGGEVDSVGMETGDAYEGFFSSSVILNGVLYYNQYNANGGTSAEQRVVAVDLHTGQELWVRNWNNTRLSFGQLYYWSSYNYMGTFAYLWTQVGTTWTAYEAFQGRWIYTITNVPSGTMARGPNGELLVLQVNQAAGWMGLWNASALVSMSGSWGSAAVGNTFNASATVNASTTVLSTAAKRAWMWNVTIPKGLSGSVQQLTDGADSALMIADKVTGARITTTEVNLWGLSLKPGQEGQLLFNTTWKPPAEWAAGNVSVSWAISDFEDNVGALWVKETRQYYGFSLATGVYLWGPTEPEGYLNIYASSRSATAYGRLFTVGYSGVCHCYNATTGKLLWTYTAVNSYALTELWGNWPLYMGFITDGKIYLHSAEHSPNQPLPRGAPFTCLNATTGEVIFTLNVHGSHWGESPIIGDSIIAMDNEYDDRIYAVGKGPSSTTVQAPMTAITAGDNVVVQGAVTDVSPGTKEYALTARFPNGVPAVSDDSMSAWMQYVYMQFPRPTNATGVEVTLDAVDPNGNFIHIGTVTSDTDGKFSYMWTTPDVPGKYTIIATFAGTNSYYASYDETAAGVSEAPPSPTPTPAEAPLPPYEMYTIGTGIAIIIAVAIVGILLLRKRP